MRDFSELQNLLALWQMAKFGNIPLELSVLGVAEETGELSHAVLKHIQGIRGMGDMDLARAEVVDALGDIAVYCMQVASRLGIDWADAVWTTAEQVMERTHGHPAIPAEPPDLCAHALAEGKWCVQCQGEEP